MKKFGSWSEQVDSKFRTSGDNKVVTLAVPSTLAGASLSLTTPNISSGTTDVLLGRISTDAGTDRLQNKELSDDNVRFVDAADTTKKVEFNVSGIATSTTRVFTFPNITDELVTLNSTSILANKTLTLPQINDTSSDHQYIFAVNELSADRTVTLPLLTGNDTFVFESHSQTLTNKTLTDPTITVKDNAFTVENSADASKKLDFNLVNIAPATTRTMIVPDYDDTLAVVDGAQTFSNKTFKQFGHFIETETISANSVAPSEGSMVHITGGSGPLNTMAADADGSVRIVYNGTGADLVIADQAAGAGSFRTGTGIDLTMEDNTAIYVVYEEGHWNVVGGAGAGGGLLTEVITGTTSAENNKHYLADTSGGAFNLNLPAGTTGAVIRVTDASETWQTNNLTIDGSGAETIDGDTTLVCDVQGAWVQLMWDGTEWVTDDPIVASAVDLTGDLSIDGSLTTTGDVCIDTDTLYVDTTNNRVGVGEDVLNNKFVVHGGADATTRIQLTNNTYGNAELAGVALGQTSGSWFLWGYENEPFRLGVNGSERLRVTEAGDVGIAEQAPEMKLEINADDDDDGLLISEAGDRRLAIQPWGVSSARLHMIDGGTLGFWANGSEIGRWFDTGNLNIQGSTDTGADLQIGPYGTDADPSLQFGTTGNSNGSYINCPSLNVLVIGHAGVEQGRMHSNGALHWGNGLTQHGDFNNSQLVISGTDGEVTTIADANFDADQVALFMNNDDCIVQVMCDDAAGKQAQLRLGKEANTFKTVVAYDVTGDYAQLTHSSNAGFKVYSGGGATMGSPSGGVKGAGTINAQGVYDDNTLLTDYVFEKYYTGSTVEARHSNYMMKSLEEEISHTQEKLHLSTIVGREEWEQGSLPLGKLASQLWETIETQFLYIKELHDRIKVLELKGN